MPNRSGRDKFLSALGRVLGEKQDAIIFRTGLLGRYDQLGGKQVAVEGRPGYVWVRMSGKDSQTLQVFNDRVGLIWGIPVKMIKDPLLPRTYRIEGKDIGKQETWDNNYVPNHAAQHMFSSVSTAGRDIVFIYKRQMMEPLQCHPTSPNSMAVFVEPDFYYWAGNFERFVGGTSENLAPYKPGVNQARFVLIYLDGATGTIKVQTGITFNSVFPPLDMIAQIPEINPAIGYPLASVYLASTTTVIGWDQMYDMRMFLSAGGSAIPMAHALDPAFGFHTGQLPAADVTIVDSGNLYVATQVENALAEVMNAANDALALAILGL
jgi:hypothetical protein